MSTKISIGINLQSGSWGGSNQFGHSLSTYLEEKGFKVFFDLTEPDLDIILLTDPRSDLISSAYSDVDILEYLRYRNRKAIVIHRINECDERKQTQGVNETLIKANKCADHTIFIASWLQNLFISHGIKCISSSVILNGSNSVIYNSNGYVKWNRKAPIKIISHHWSNNWLKGFDIYERLDTMLDKSYWQKKIEFTYVGNLPLGFKFRNTNYISPKYGKELSNILQSHHIYLTASRNEPAGMHHIEGAMSGLPILYIHSGAFPEYCDGFGISFTTKNFEEKLQNMLETYDNWINKISKYPHTAEKMNREYYSLFINLMKKKDEIVARRKPLPKISLSDKMSYYYGNFAKSIKNSVKSKE